MFEKGDRYISEVIKPLLPEAKLSTYLQVGLNSNSDINISLEPFELFKNSQYELTFEDDTYLIHFTSINNLLNIIRSKSLWMNDLNSMEDKSEFVFANKHLSKNDSESLKSNILSLSFCEFSENTVLNDFMWKRYGENHKGVCLKIKLHKKRNLPPWFFIGKINYEKNEVIKELKDLKNRHDDFHEKYGYSISNINELLYSVSSMYKTHQDYHQEKEIRLLNYINSNSEPLKNYSKPPLEHKYNIDVKKFNYFKELPINRRNDDIIAPHISIEEIIFGKNIDDGEFLILKRLIEEKYEIAFNCEIKATFIQE